MTTREAIDWPELPLAAWRDTCETLHRWMQVIGKIQLALTPTINHWWNVPLHVTARGFATSAIPYGDRWFDLELDFQDDVLRIHTDEGALRAVALGPRTVADFYRQTMAALRAEGILCRIWPVPVEIEDTIPFDRDDRHRSYDKRYVMRFWRIVGHATAILTEFRARFIGKASPVQFFWGTFDLAASRFSGRRAPPMPGANRIEREAYSHEVISSGWWPGDSRLHRAAFYTYASPEPDGFRDAAITTPGAYYNDTLKGFYLHYDDFRSAPDPSALLLDFCEKTYAAAADLAHWDRQALEREREPEMRPPQRAHPATEAAPHLG